MSAFETPYEAIRVITFNDVRAYNPGDPVPVAAVEGPGAWLVLGEDVARRQDEPAAPSPPAPKPAKPAASGNNS